MLQTVAGLIIALFCVVGVVSAIKWLMLRLTAPCSGDTRIYTVVLKGDSADIELQMANETLNWDSGLLNVRAYAVDCGIAPECLAACEEMCRSSRFRLVTAEELSEILQSYSNKK